MTRLETPRLILREIKLGDAAAFSKYNERLEFYRYITKQPDQETTRVLVERNVARNKALPRRHWYFSILKKETKFLIGDIVIAAHEKHPESLASIGYGMNPDFWGQGLMTEALQAVTEFGHNVLGFHRISTGADLGNVGSWRVMEKCGYVRESVEAYSVKTPSGWSPQTVQYASVRPELIHKE